MNAHSHPEKEERDRFETAGEAPKTVPCDKVLRNRLLTLRDEGPEAARLSNSMLGKRIGVSESIISQYLNKAGCVYPGHIDVFEKKAWDFIQNEGRRKAFGVETIQCDSTDETKKALEYIRKTTDIGLIIEDSGGGKTRGMEFYHKENPTSILYSVSMWNCRMRDLETFFFKIAGKGDWDGQTKYSIHAIKKLAGCERLIMVDNAHFLHHTALLWLVQFAEETQMPLALAGTDKLLDVVESDPQIFSRVGLNYDLRDGSKNFKISDGVLRHHIQRIASDCNGETEQLLSYCRQVAVNSGHYRSVLKQLKLAAEMRAIAKKPMTWLQAFRAAHTKLVRAYALD